MRILGTKGSLRNIKKLMYFIRISRSDHFDDFQLHFSKLRLKKREVKPQKEA